MVFSKMMNWEKKVSLIAAFAVAGLIASVPANAAYNGSIEAGGKSPAFPVPVMDILGGSTSNPELHQPQGIQLAQSDDAAFRMSQMEEQMRVLNGKVEDMTFQLLQLQEQIRKMQEDNEFRFQELENRGDLKQGNENVAKAGEPGLGKPQPSDPTADNGGSDGEANRKSITELLDGDVTQDGPERGEPPISLGTLTFDGDGNLVDSNVGKPIDLTGKQPAVDLPDSPDALFDLGYQYVQAGQYDQAEEVFSRHVSDFPRGPQGP